MTQDPAAHALKTRHFDRISNGGLTFTELGFGSAPLGNLFRAIGNDEAHAILKAAWDSGCRYLDTAPLYGLGLAETRYNRFLHGLDRSDYVLSTKVGRVLEPCAPSERDGVGKWFDVPARKEVYDYSHDGIMRSLEHSLERLGQDHVDVLFVHDIDVANHGSVVERDRCVDQFFLSGYDALVKLRDQGVIKAFGAGVNEWEVCQIFAERGDMDLFLLAGRYTLLEQEALETFLPLCEARGIGIVLGGPYNSGILARDKDTAATYNYAAAPADIVDRVSAIGAVCAAHGIPMAAAALQFPLHHPSVVSVIPGGQSVAETEANRAHMDVVIPDAFWRDLKDQGLMRADAPTP
ncbi:MAG: aldo/keto reductase [Pseudomonadota bacterium]